MRLLNLRLILLTFISLNVFSYQSNDSYLESFFNLFKTENKNYFICDYTESDMSRTFIIDTKRKEFIWSEVPKYVDFDILEKSIKIVGLEELLNVFPEMLEGKLKNRILIDVNK